MSTKLNLTPLHSFQNWVSWRKIIGPSGHCKCIKICFQISREQLVEKKIATKTAWSFFFLSVEALVNMVKQGTSVRFMCSFLEASRYSFKLQGVTSSLKLYLQASSYSFQLKGIAWKNSDFPGPYTLKCFSSAKKCQMQEEK